MGGSQGKSNHNVRMTSTFFYGPPIISTSGVQIQVPSATDKGTSKSQEGQASRSAAK